MAIVGSDWFSPSYSVAREIAAIHDGLSSGMPPALCLAIQRLPVPPMATGCTQERFYKLAEIAALDLSLGRLFEGHADALNILRTAGLEPQGGTYGVWAADTSALSALETDRGWQLQGTKPYCSGAPFLVRALVTGLAGERSRLFEVEVGSGTHLISDSWPSLGMAASQSFSVAFERSPVVRTVGEPEYYTSRPGFWQGSLNVPACWFGGALGLARGVLTHITKDPSAHNLAAFGLLSSEIDAMAAVLSTAAEATDLDPEDLAGLAKERAFSTRNFVYQSATRAIELASQIGGTGGIAHDPDQARRLADLPVYLRQHHPGRDSETLGRLSIARYSGA